MTGVCRKACRMTGKNDLHVSSAHRCLEIRSAKIAKGTPVTDPNSPTNPTNSIRIPVIGHLKNTMILHSTINAASWRSARDRGSFVRSMEEDSQDATRNVHSAEKAQGPSPFLSP